MRVISEGIGAALALETGVAALGNMEAVQFHPTGIFPAGILVTEGCRGDGGLLRDAAGHRFMPDYEPEKKELASRDVVSRRMAEHIRAGHGAASRFGPHLWLDITLLGRAHIDRNLREVKEICRYFLGIDPAVEWIPVHPAQHYTMGGIRTKHTGESPTLRGLFAAGEAACWDLHGFNRLGGNSVAETVVAGMVVGEFVADFCAGPDGDSNIPTKLLHDAVDAERCSLDALLESRGTESAASILAEMQQVMTADVGIFRNAPGLAAAVGKLQALLQRCGRIGLRRHRDGPESGARHCLPGSAHAEARAVHRRGRARARREPRRTFPRGLPAPRRCALARAHARDVECTRRRGSRRSPMSRSMWRRWSCRRDGAATARATTSIIPTRRAAIAEVQALRERCKGQARHELQDALMPYRHLLPERLRGANQRLPEGLR